MDSNGTKAKFTQTIIPLYCINIRKNNKIRRFMVSDLSLSAVVNFVYLCSALTIEVRFQIWHCLKVVEF